MENATEFNELVDVERDGLKLRVRVDKPSNSLQPKHAVLIMHGLLGDSGYGPQNLLQELADKFVAHDYIAVRFDFNGHGKSEGRLRDADLFNETEDALAVLDYVLAREDVQDVALIGHSAGAVVAGMVAGMESDKVRALVMLSPAASLKNDAMRGVLLDVTFDPIHVPQTITVADGQVDIDGKYVRIARMLPVYEAAALFHGPALAIQGGEDTVIAPSCAHNYAEAMSHCTATEFAKLTHAFDGDDRETAIDEAVQFVLTLDEAE